MADMLRTIGWAVLCAAACFGPLLFIGYGLPVLSYILRRRGARRKKRHAQQHNSRIPYRLIAYLLLGITLLLTGFVVAGFINGTFKFPDDLNGTVALPLPTLLLAIAAFRAYILQKMPTAARAIENDARPPVLYLRSFDQESIMFASVKPEEFKKYNDYLNYADDIQLPKFERKVFEFMNNFAGLISKNDLVYSEDVTFEKYFRSDVMKHIGPFVALGNPIDDLPAEGAFRDYQVDDSWKEVFYSRADQSACILMQLGSSNNLQFELTSILSRGMRQKLFILTSPLVHINDKFAWVRKYILREKTADWDTFSTILKSNGYDVPEGPLGAGSVITFEPDGRPLILVQGALKPEEYIIPICERLKELKILQ
jgi:hypothetical protein